LTKRCLCTFRIQSCRKSQSCGYVDFCSTHFSSCSTRLLLSIKTVHFIASNIAFMQKKTDLTFGSFDNYNAMLNMELPPITPSNEPTVTAILDPPHPEFSTCPRYGSVHLMALNLETRTVLSKFDRNGDGDIDPSELEEVVDELVKSQFKSRLFMAGMIMVIFSLVLLLGSGFGLTWAVVLAHKDTTINDKFVLLSSSTNKPVQATDANYTVAPSGLLLSRSSAGTVATGAYYAQRMLNSSMTSEELTYLARVCVLGANGAELGLRVTGYKLLSGSPAQLHVHTPSGTLVLTGSKVDNSTVPANLLDPSITRWIGPQKDPRSAAPPASKKLSLDAGKVIQQ
ncbi:hypothetical protein Agub_g1674, partial [Astrephomene gubernaculifera]